MQAKAKTIAVAYLRMSDKKQDKSIPAQREEIERYARAHGYTIIRWYVDEGISGDDTKHRLQFQTMHKAACHGRDFDAILVWDSDRFGRFDSLESGYWVHPLRQAARLPRPRRSRHTVPHGEAVGGRS